MKFQHLVLLFAGAVLGSGNFGPVPMVSNAPDKISDKDLKEAVELILKS